MVVCHRGMSGNLDEEEEEEMALLLMDWGIPRDSSDGSFGKGWGSEGTRDVTKGSSGGE